MNISTWIPTGSRAFHNLAEGKVLILCLLEFALTPTSFITNSQSAPQAGVNSVSDNLPSVVSTAGLEVAGVDRRFTSEWMLQIKL